MCALCKMDICTIYFTTIAACVKKDISNNVGYYSSIKLLVTYRFYSGTENYNYFSLPELFLFLRNPVLDITNLIGRLLLYPIIFKKYLY